MLPRSHCLMAAACKYVCGAACLVPSPPPRFRPRHLAMLPPPLPPFSPDPLPRPSPPTLSPDPLPHPSSPPLFPTLLPLPSPPPLAPTPTLPRPACVAHRHALRCPAFTTARRALGPTPHTCSGCGRTAAWLAWCVGVSAWALLACVRALVLSVCLPCTRVGRVGSLQACVRAVASCACVSSVRRAKWTLHTTPQPPLWACLSGCVLGRDSTLR